VRWKKASVRSCRTELIFEFVIFNFFIPRLRRGLHIHFHAVPGALLGVHFSHRIAFVLEVDLLDAGRFQLNRGVGVQRDELTRRVAGVVAPSAIRRFVVSKA
jgi:hypothetical protein